MTTTTGTVLPAPQYPMVTRVVSEGIFPEIDPNTQKPEKPLRYEPVTWTVSKNHPFIGPMRVVRMFMDRGGVEIYSVSHDGQNGMRNFIPMNLIRLIEEAMPLDVFVEELGAAESSVDEDEDDEGESTGVEDEGQAPPVPSSSNGQISA